MGRTAHILRAVCLGEPDVLLLEELRHEGMLHACKMFAQAPSRSPLHSSVYMFSTGAVNIAQDRFFLVLEFGATFPVAQLAPVQNVAGASDWQVNPVSLSAENDQANVMFSS